MQDLQKLFIGELSEIYDAENQLVQALPKMADKAGSEELKNAFRRHLDQTQGHVRRLERVFQAVGEQPNRKSCKGMAALIDEGELMAAEFEGNTALDAGLIAAAQKVEHYEISTYGCLCTWAKESGMNEALDLLKQNLSEEKETDEKLTHLATSRFNIQAAEHDTDKRSPAMAKVAKVVS